MKQKQVTRVRGGAPVRRKATRRKAAVAPAVVRPPVISGPFWSDAMQCYRIEFSEQDRSVPGGWYTSSFFIRENEVAQAVAGLIPARCSRKQWVRLFKVAMAVAKQYNAVLYRTMLGGYERFDPKHKDESTPANFRYQH